MGSESEARKTVRERRGGVLGALGLHYKVQPAVGQRAVIQTSERKGGSDESHRDTRHLSTSIASTTEDENTILNRIVTKS